MLPFKFSSSNGGQKKEGKDGKEKIKIFPNFSSLRVAGRNERRNEPPPPRFFFEKGE